MAGRFHFGLKGKNQNIFIVTQSYVGEMIDLFEMQYL